MQPEPDAISPKSPPCDDVPSTAAAAVEMPPVVVTDDDDEAGTGEWPPPMPRSSNSVALLAAACQAQAQDGVPISVLLNVMNSLTNLLSTVSASDDLHNLRESLAMCGDRIDKMLGRAVREQLQSREQQADTVLSAHIKESTLVDALVLLNYETLALVSFVCRLSSYYSICYKLKLTCDTPTSSMANKVPGILEHSDF